MRSSTFPVSGLAGRALATAHILNAASCVIPAASPSELHYIWKRLKDESYVWQVFDAAYTERHTAENQAIIRLVSFFWAAGIRPRGEQLSPEVAAFIEKVAFLLTVHRGLLAQSLCTTGGRFSLFTRREGGIRDYIETSQPHLVQSEFYAECLGHLRAADMTIYCAREEENPMLVPALTQYLHDYCLRAEDVGITPEELARWQHQQLVLQAKMKFGVCRPFENENHEPCTPATSTIYANIYGALAALTGGVSLEEAGISTAELLEVKIRLERWLPHALAYPQDYGMNADVVKSFTATVMPMFDQVLGNRLYLVR